MYSAVVLLGMIEGCEQRDVLVQFSFADGLVNTSQFLPDDAPGTKVEVPYLRVAHLPIGQSDLLAESRQGAVWILIPKPVHERRLGLGDRVGGWLGTQAPAV